MKFTMWIQDGTWGMVQLNLFPLRAYYALDFKPPKKYV